MKTLTHILPAALMTAAVAFSTPALAHDTEIYFSEAKADNDENQPAANVLFLIDTSGSMCQYDGGGTRQDCSRSTTRMKQLQSAFATMVDGLSEDVKVGLAKFNGGHDSSGYGGYIFYPVTEMGSSEKGEIKGLVNNLLGTSNTPLMEAYTETARYMLGMSPSDYAEKGEAITETPRRAVNVTRGCTRWWSNGTCRTQGNIFAPSYDSPINMANQCESNHIVVMTDGAPTEDTDYVSAHNIAGGSCNSSYACQTDLARFLNTDSPRGKKPIKTWQIGFGIGQNSTQAGNMLDVADAGGTEKVYFADNAEELAQAFIDIMNLIDRNTRAISSPGVAVSQTNRFQNLDELYYALFEPAESTYWQGNLKRYRMNHSTQEVVDRNGANAIDPDTALFTSTSSSFWSNTVDGSDIELGGAREQAEVSRKLLYTTGPGANLTSLNYGNPPPSEFFGLEEDQDIERNLIVTELQSMWADPLHSEPLMVNYGMSGGSEQNYIFVSTNGGMLHAIDTRNGSEKFAFMPYEMISKADKLALNRPGLDLNNIRQIYGLDSSWTAWRQTEAGSDTPNKVHLYGGMRRGGDSYYALNVTNINTPEMLWQITPSTAGFEKLGQTWSKPKMAYFPDSDGKPVPVVVFGGGYSPEDHDRTAEQYQTDSYPDRSAADQKGNAVYAVNANTGQLVWSASTAAMKWAIPGSIAVVDVNSDGITDHLYFADLGGQVFRVDIDSSSGDLNHSVELIAQLGGSGENHRRFYEQPAVAFVREENRPVLYVTLGSGYRAHPKDTTTQEAFFVIKDDSALQPKSTVVATLSNLQNVTSGNIETLDPDSRGWYYTLADNGEKALASPVVFNYEILFTTYAPTEQDSDDVCSVRYGEAFLHRVDLRTGNSIDSREFRRQKLDQSTPPPTPTILLGEDNTISLLVGTEVIVSPGGGLDAERLERLRQLRTGRWMQLTPDAAGEIRNPNSESEEGAP